MYGKARSIRNSSTDSQCKGVLKIIVDDGEGGLDLGDGDEEIDDGSG